MFERLDHLHFLLIPFPSQGHIIPLTDFAKLLAHHGVAVSIITTPRNYARYKPAINHAVEAGLKLQMIPVEFPGQEAGLPQGCEDINSLPSMELADCFFKACEMMASPLERLIAEMHPNPSCIVSTNALPWTQRVADTFKIPRYIFETISCFTLLCSHILSHHETTADLESRVVLDIPHKIELTRAQLPDSKSKSLDNDGETIVDQIRKATHLARASLVNSFEEMEAVYAQGYRKVARKLWCIGPVSLHNKASSDDHRDCISWLDNKDPGSVIYACFGSFSAVSNAQIKEIGLGLEASGFPFVWIIRGMDSSLEVEKWLDEERFEERVEGRGLVIRGWAPQVLILSHPSVGGFLTHCGWNSTLESVSAGVPMITWPMFSEQFLNEKFIVHVLEIGVRIGVEVEATKEALVKWDRVKKAIENLMGEDEEGRERRRRAKKLAGIAGEALEQNGSSYMNIKLFIQDVVSCME